MKNPRQNQNRNQNTDNQQPSSIMKKDDKKGPKKQAVIKQSPSTETATTMSLAQGESQQQRRSEVQDFHKKKPFWITRSIANDFTRADVLKAALFEGSIYVLFVIAVVMSAEGKRGVMLYHLTTALVNEFQETSFEEIAELPDLWKYLTENLLDHLYSENYYDRNNPVAPSDEDDHKILFNNQILGVPRIRQLRVRNHSCTVSPMFKSIIKKCYAPYSKKAEDHEPFGEGEGTAWTYSSPEKTGNLKYRGTFGTYEGGGYYQDLGQTSAESEEILNSLKDKQWITRATRAVIIDFSVYNPNLDLICVCKLVFQLPEFGGVTESLFLVETMIPKSGVYGDDKMYVAFEIIVYVFFLLFGAEELREVIYFKKKYFCFWTLIDLAVMGLILANFITAVFLIPNIDDILSDIGKHQDKYGNLENLAIISNQNTDICAILLFLTIVKVFKYLNVYKQLGQLNDTLGRCLFDLVCFSWMFLVIFCAFALSGHLVFGNDSKDQKDVWASMFSLLATILGQFEYSDLENANSEFAPVYFSLFNFIVFFICLNMFLAIISDSYCDVKTELDLAPPEMTVFEFLRIRLFSYLRRVGIDFKNRPKIRDLNEPMRQIRESIAKLGFSDLEIEMFFARFNVNTSEQIVHYDNRNILKQLEELQKEMDANDVDNAYVQLIDFLEQQDSLDRLEYSISLLSKKLELIVSRLSEYESDRAAAVANQKG